MKAIEFSDFTFAYKRGGVALRNIDLSIPRGSFTVITGPCGAGKTTLCMAINGLVPHYFGGSVSGEVLVDKQNTLQRKVSDLALLVGTVMEDFESQLVAMTVADEIAFGLENRGVSKAEINKRTGEILSLVGLAGMEAREIGSLSGGQKQRLAIAAVLVTDADILVLDEPSSALDPQGADELYALLYKLNCSKKLTIVVVEHDLAKVLPYADQLVFMDGGSIVVNGSPATAMGVIYAEAGYRMYVPALQELKIALEQLLAVEIADWTDETAAIADITQMITRARLEVTKSA